MRLVDSHRTGSIATAAGIAMLLGLAAVAWAAPTDGSHPQPATGAYISHASPVPHPTTTADVAPPTWPANPEPLARPAATGHASSPGFDWGAAGIGAGTMAVIVGVALGAIGMVLRRRRKPRSASFAR
jgi:hypothetical protein